MSIRIELKGDPIRMYVLPRRSGDLARITTGEHLRRVATNLPGVSDQKNDKHERRHDALTHDV